MRTAAAILGIAFLALAPALARAQAAERIDLVLTGRAIGPLPLRLGVESEFELTVTNPGPRPVTTFVLATAPWYYDRPQLDIARQSAPCGSGDDRGLGFIQYNLFVAFVGEIPVGGFRTCRFRLTTRAPMYEGATLAFEAYENGNYNQALDLDFSDNCVPFGIGPPPRSAVSVPSAGLAALMLLGLALALSGLVVARGIYRART